MIDYFYTRDYMVDDLDFSAASFKQLTESFIEDFCSVLETSTGLGPLPFHMMMYLLAHRMEISGLKLLAKDRVTRFLIDNMTLDIFPWSISAIYNTYNMNGDPVHELRDIAVQGTIDHRADLRRGNPMVLGNDLLDDMPEFTRDVLIAMMDREMEGDQGMTVYYSPSCWGTW
ncbi:uncharacterized protein TRUGW13939_10972 [Talaromyces rugulosus]|uniref:BTB domain-containing protein n=1 Tax=Talaromyces rugulosus TaxID=121627 RepID=A0A7H8RDK3_TALRU|nr:uncharacterized protein TRUGW13939_10972 [Talaromyces rugulosus]QKX63801.1 hypothetical protein TRUGW13939_10972 [Talaromyces rugulosus]